jgi:hypothetical protein
MEIWRTILTKRRSGIIGVTKSTFYRVRETTRKAGNFKEEISKKKMAKIGRTNSKRRPPRE